MGCKLTILSPGHEVVVVKLGQDIGPGSYALTMPPKPSSDIVEELDLWKGKYAILAGEYAVAEGWKQQHHILQQELVKAKKDYKSLLNLQDTLTSKQGDAWFWEKEYHALMSVHTEALTQNEDDINALQAAMAARDTEISALKQHLAEIKADVSKGNHICEQILEKALGFPSYKDDLENFPDATVGNGVCVGHFGTEDLCHIIVERYEKAITALGPFALEGKHWLDVGVPDDHVPMLLSAPIDASEETLGTMHFGVSHFTYDDLKTALNIHMEYAENPLPYSPPLSSPEEEIP